MSVKNEHDLVFVTADPPNEVANEGDMCIVRTREDAIRFSNIWDNYQIHETPPSWYALAQLRGEVKNTRMWHFRKDLT